MHKTAIKILEATVGIESNTGHLLPHFPFRKEVKSLLTDFKSVDRIAYSSNLDGYILIEESAGEPSIKFSGNNVKFKGPFLKLENQASDLRFSLWGNQGFLYRYSLYLLEKKHRIYNFHACALYFEEKDHLNIVIGGAGSGKTVYLLSGLAQGLKLFSTETVHFRVDKDDISWFMGSLVDNVRVGTLKHNFPQFLKSPKISEKEEWQNKIALDLSFYRTDFEKIKNPKAVTILFPRIEEGRKGFLLSLMDDKRKAAKALFDNISQKLSETFVLYDRVPVIGFDERPMAYDRLENVNKLAYHKSVIRIASVLSNPYECWGDLLK